MSLVLPDLVNHSLMLFIPFEAIYYAGKRFVALANGAGMCVTIIPARNYLSFYPSNDASFWMSKDKEIIARKPE